jgi:hypothetical protein
MRYIAILLLLTTISTSCGNTPNESVSDEKKELTEQEKEDRKMLIGPMMQLHDIAMEQMELMNTKREELSNLKANITDTALLQHITFVEERVTETEEMMMNWMRGYEEPDFKMPQDSALIYLEEKRMKIEEVYARMLEAINILDDAIARAQ